MLLLYHQLDDTFDQDACHSFWGCPRNVAALPDVGGSNTMLSGRPHEIVCAELMLSVDLVFTQAEVAVNGSGRRRNSLCCCMQWSVDYDCESCFDLMDSLSWTLSLSGCLFLALLFFFLFFFHLPPAHTHCDAQPTGSVAARSASDSARGARSLRAPTLRAARAMHRRPSPKSTFASSA